ncbi:uncharacterized protein LOC128755927 [Synchiropus splendidus]|uniref:uncharacterized protein LOC128755927 n=1 Tax=Synchiropus splendidus TaxID=270530 RepID=UPI00237D6A17|nr:uncharacterized protein LOC128755927 [Synchiropus splendidus]
MAAVDLSLTEGPPRFEALDGTGVFPITEQYAAQCGYTINTELSLHRVELRASYFSCHTRNKDDEVFTFYFNVIVMHEGIEMTHTFNRTCSPALPWASREVVCEENYMEVSVRSDVVCPTRSLMGDLDSVKMAYASATSDWQVMFQRELKPMNLTQAHDRQYAFDLTDGRLVFRTPYGQPDSISTTVNGVPVEVVHATLLSRQSWVVLMVDLVAACSMYEGSYDDTGYIVWEAPEVPHPLLNDLHGTQIRIGIKGELFKLQDAEQMGYFVEKANNTVQVSIAYDAEGGSRKSYVAGGLHEYYTFHLHLEQTSEDADTELHVHRTLTTALLPYHVFTRNNTVLEEKLFKVHLGDFPEDVQLVSVQLNGRQFKLPLANTSSFSVSMTEHNNTHGYTLQVAFDDPVVNQQFSKEDSAIHHSLDINYTLVVLPENDSFHHFTSVLALTDVSPPVFTGACSESGVSFKLKHRPFDFLWYVSVGDEALTSELASQYSYTMSNDSSSLQISVPLFTQGYEYKNVTLDGFFGTFEILVRNVETAEVASSTVKTCHFTPKEFIMCSTDGWMTAAADLPFNIPRVGTPPGHHLVDRFCTPKEANNTRTLFSFPLNSCGSTVKLRKEYVTYENKVFYGQESGLMKPAASLRMTLQCTYPLEGLKRLFSTYKFQSDVVGVGHIVHSDNPAAGSEHSVAKPTAAAPLITRPVKYSYAPQYIKMSNYLQSISKKGKWL